MHRTRAFLHQARFEKAIARAAESLAPEVVKVIPTLDEDWTGQPAVFFMVILPDPVTKTDQLYSISKHAREIIVEQVQPLERWGVWPFFSFRSQSEQARHEQPAVEQPAVA